MAALLLLVGGIARADTITTFAVSGTAQNVSGGSLGSCQARATCGFSGTLTIDVTSGFVTTVDISFPGLSRFDLRGNSFSTGTSDWKISALNLPDLLGLKFTTTKTPGSLLGFTGGSIVGGQIDNPLNFKFFYTNLRGSITPVLVPIPEPSSLALLSSGLLGSLALGLVGRRSKRSPDRQLP